MKHRKTETEIINEALVAGTVVSVKAYADMQFSLNQIAVNAALSAQEKAVAAALAAQRDKGSGRQEIWAYIVGAIGLIIGVVTAFFTRHT
jgi:hypothetical protein